MLATCTAQMSLTLNLSKTLSVWMTSRYLEDPRLLGMFISYLIPILIFFHAACTAAERFFCLTDNVIQILVTPIPPEGMVSPQGVPRGSTIKRLASLPSLPVSSF